MDITFKTTIALCKVDIDRRLTLENKARSGVNRLLSLTSRGVISVMIYRLKRYLYFKNNLLCKILVRQLKYPEFHICHNEIDPRADIGPGLVLSDSGGVSLSYAIIIGKNCTFMGKATPTLGAMEGIDPITDRIRFGDYCVIGHNVKVINPVVIADGVQIKSNSVLMSSIKSEGALVSGFPAKKIGTLALASVRLWNPLLSRMLPDLKV